MEKAYLVDLWGAVGKQRISRVGARPSQGGCDVLWKHFFWEEKRPGLSSGWSKKAPGN